MPDPVNEDVARGRFVMLNLVRLGAVVLTLFSMLILGDAIKAPYALGYVLLGVGLVGIFVVPQMLARRWRSPSDPGRDVDEKSGPE
jgi:membrane protein YdbS with pleckstrin-like domain